MSEVSLFIVIKSFKFNNLPEVSDTEPKSSHSVAEPNKTL